MSITPSCEQQRIIDTFKSGENIAILSSAGSGKTTTILFLAQQCPDKNILALTFNRGLADDTKQKIKKLNLTNLEIQTYHGFCTKYFGACYNDEALFKYLSAGPRSKLDYIDLLIIDEMQDMNILYYNFISNKLQFLHPHNKLILIGDSRQTIYQFNGGNPQYLLEPEKYWSRPFIRCYLKTTYRLTHKICQFVNTLICSKYADPFEMLTIDKKTDYPVEYHWINLFDQSLKIIKDIISRYGVDQILIIAISIKEKTPIRQCVNKLSSCGIPVCVLKDEDVYDPDVVKNKLIVSSIHKQKGRERKIVIVFGLDCSYHTYYGKNKSVDEYLNLIYVACTRSLEKLIILGDKKHGFLKNWTATEVYDLVNKGIIKLYGEPLEKCECSLSTICQCKNSKVCNVCDIIKHRAFS